MRVPGNDYKPNDWAEEDYMLKDAVLALNSVEEGQATPYLISSQLIDFTFEFSDKAVENHAEDIAQYNTEEWKDQYKDGITVFVPENRWTHEVQRGPVHIQDNLYAIYLDADIFIKPFVRFYHDDKNEGGDAIAFDFISRTLYKYVRDSGSIVKRDSYKDLSDEDDCLTLYNWVVRWLPYKDSKLTFYTTKEIEDKLGFRVEPFVVDCDESMTFIEVPVIFKKDLKSIVPYLKHDSLIMYLEVQENEEK